MTAVLVIGYGSIGQRHASILSNLECDVAIVSRRIVNHSKCFSSLDKALTEHNPDYIIVANETQQHAITLAELEQAKYQHKVLVEKPLYNQITKQSVSFMTYVAYNLRLHPLLLTLKEFLHDCKVYSVRIHAGQYLPNWRPDSDYRLSYSARKSLGGGVLRDLSHEIDYATWLFGKVKHLTALGGKFSDLEIDSDDHFSLLLVTEFCSSLLVSVNYLDNPPQRHIHLTTSKGTVLLDFIKGTLNVEDEQIYQCQSQRNDTYIAQHQAILNDEVQHLCTYEEGIETMQLIQAAEQAVFLNSWITL